MTVECIGEGFLYRSPGGEVRLEPGTPIDLPDERAKRLIMKARGRVRVIPPAVQPGGTIAWVRVNGTIQTGTVDWIHCDDTGIWAFVSIGESWTALNLKYLTLVWP
ncbi:MAG: hypothetical protein L0H94_01965 [Nitrospira sp.]|nr:hypothetical protein [Nitrospira sp.]